MKMEQDCHPKENTMFTLTVTPTTQTISRGDAAIYTIRLHNANHANGPYEFAVASGLPALATATFMPATLPASGHTTFTVQTSPLQPVSGKFEITVQARGLSEMEKVNVELIVF